MTGSNGGGERWASGLARIRSWLPRRAKLLSTSFLFPAFAGAVLLLEGWALMSPQASPPPVRFLAARKPVPAGQPVTPIEFELVAGDTPPEPGTLTDGDLHRIQDATTRQPLSAGEMLTWDKILLPGSGRLSESVPRGMRAYALPLDASAEGVRFGDLVDVLHAPDHAAESPYVAVEAARVVRAVPGEALTLAVESADLEILEKARRQGKLTVVVRNPKDGNLSSRPRRRSRTAGRRARASVPVFAEGE